MKPLPALLAIIVVTLSAGRSLAQALHLEAPKGIEAGSSLPIATSGRGLAELYVVGPGGAVRRTVHLGETVTLGQEELHNAGHYTAFLVAGSAQQSLDFEVTAAEHPARLAFLAKPSRLPVDRANAVSGVVYVFDAYENLILAPVQVSFEFGNEAKVAPTRNGIAWVSMNSASRAGIARFHAAAGSLTEERVVQQVPGDPCSLRMNVKASGPRILVETEPVRDCQGNAVPDGTIVSFTESHDGSQSTVDVPLKRGVARTEMPAIDGAVISVATGVVLGNEVHWSGR